MAATWKHLIYSAEMIKMVSFGVMTVSLQTISLLKPLIKSE